MQIIVRPIEETDYAAFERLYVGLLEFDRPHHPQGTLPEFDAILTARRSNARETMRPVSDRSVLVATYPSEVLIGYIIVQISDPGDASTDGTMRTGSIYELSVDESGRGSGAGTALLEASEQWFREQGALRIKVEAFAWNAEAISFYERRGFMISDVILTRWL